MQANNTRSHGIYRDVQMVILRHERERERESAKEGKHWRRGTSTPRIRHMLLLLLLLLLPAFDNNYTPASRNPHKPPSTPHDCRRKLCCAGETSRESIRFANKLADHYTKLAKCDSVPFQLGCLLWEVICEMIPMRPYQSEARHQFICWIANLQSQIISFAKLKIIIKRFIY